MDKNYLKIIAISGVVALPAVLAYFAYSHPGYFSSQTYLEGLIFLEFLAAAVWLFRKTFYPVVIVSFLLAGVELPVGSMWTIARWLVLGIGALVGSTIMLKDRRYPFNMFHLLAFFTILAGMVSAAVSHYTTVSSLKVLSLLLLFVYSGTGARLAVFGRENRFFAGLVTGTEIFAGIVAAFYLMGREIMGNPNSLGAVMGVAAAPILLWGMLVAQDSFARRRRLLLYTIAMYLTYASRARAAILAACLSSILLCLVLRKYKLLAQGIGSVAILVATIAILAPEVYTDAVSTVTSTVVFKGRDPSEGLLASRHSPWQDTMDTIHDHFWFGTGFGTSDTSEDSAEIGNFASSSTTSSEHGSSYLEIIAWVGMMGVLPFILLLGVLATKVFQTFVWIYRNGNASYAAVPLATLMFSAMVNAAFEDWLFAPGYYLCVFFWTMAFIFMDQADSLSPGASRNLTQKQASVPWREVGAIAPGR